MTEFNRRITLNRRRCLQWGAALGASIAVKQCVTAEENGSLAKNILVFVKPIQDLTFSEVADWLTKWDVGGVEATIRDGGWIERKDVSEKLPRLMDALRKVDRSKVILASDIHSDSDPDVDQVLHPAAKQGVKYIRMKYYKYDLSKKILPQVDRFIDQAKKLAKVCEELNVVALYQNHAGSDYFGAPIWDLAQLMDEVNSASMRVAIDTRHTPLEATEAWKINLARVHEHIGAIFVKDGMVKEGKIVDVGLGKGTSSKVMFDRLWADKPLVPICLHMEHIDHKKPELLPSRLDAVTADIRLLKQWMGIA